MKDNYYELESNPEEGEDTPKSGVDRVVAWKAVIIFLLGLIGLSLIYTLIYSISSAFVSLDKELLENNPAKYYRIDSILQFVTYMVGLGIAVAIIAIPTVKQFTAIFEKYKDAKVYTNGLIIGIIMIFAQSIYSIIITLLFGKTDANANQSILIDMTKQSPVLLFLTTVVLAPFFEEIVYRYSLFGLIHKKNRYLAYVVSLIVFGLIHFDFGAFSDWNALKVELLNLPAYLISGGLLCYAYDKNDSLISSITAHATNNLVAFIQILIYY